jgi:hypothetical protein
MKEPTFPRFERSHQKNTSFTIFQPLWTTDCHQMRSRKVLQLKRRNDKNSGRTRINRLIRNVDTNWRCEKSNRQEKGATSPHSRAPLISLHRCECA